MIGDPSGRTAERTFLDEDVLDANRASIGDQLSSMLEFGSDSAGATLVDNRDWTGDLGLLEFLRNVGKHATINTMLAKESVRARMERDSGISFTEFSYMLLQANDFRVLHERHGVDLQVAGSDQWGNITAGVDLVRRTSGDHVHGLTAPLIVRSDGSKFGKSEGQNIWLSPRRTSPYQMYQYLLNVADPDVEDLLLRLTTLPVAECRSVAADHAASPELRGGQRRLAREVTALVHGAAVLPAVEEAASLMFGGSLLEAAPAALELLAEESPSTRMARSAVLGTDASELFVASGLARSKGEVRRGAAGYYVNQVSLERRSSEGNAEVAGADLLHGRFVLLQRGKKNRHVLIVDD